MSKELQQIKETLDVIAKLLSMVADQQCRINSLEQALFEFGRATGKAVLHYNQDIVMLENEKTVLREALKPFVDFVKNDTGREPSSPASAYPVPGLTYADFLAAITAIEK